MKYFIISDIFHPLFNLINYFGKISKIILVNLEYYKTRRGTCNMEGSYYLTIVDNNDSGKCLTGTLADEREEENRFETVFRRIVHSSS